MTVPEARRSRSVDRRRGPRPAAMRSKAMPKTAMPPTCVAPSGVRPPSAARLIHVSSWRSLLPLRREPGRRAAPRSVCPRSSRSTSPLAMASSRQSSLDEARPSARATELTGSEAVARATTRSNGDGLDMAARSPRDVPPRGATIRRRRQVRRLSGARTALSADSPNDGGQRRDQQPPRIDPARPRSGAVFGCGRLGSIHARAPTGMDNLAAAAFAGCFAVAVGCSNAGSPDGDAPAGDTVGGDAGAHPNDAGTTSPSSSADGGSAASDAAAPDASLPVVPPTPTDGVENGGETDVDCGGASSSTSDGAMPCAVGLHCLVGADCTSDVCQGPAVGGYGTCAAPSCTDGARNGAETDVDCGGGICPRLRCVQGLRDGERLHQRRVQLRPRLRCRPELRRPQRRRHLRSRRDRRRRCEARGLLHRP